MRSPRGLLLLLALVATLVGVLQGVTGLQQLTLYAGPFLILLGLLLSGRYVGEEKILARRRVAGPRLRSALARRWNPGRDRPLTSILARAPRTLRGPPLPAPA